MSKRIIKAWVFRSDSNPDKTYETLKYDDDTTSCSCPGWTRRVERSCKHTRMVDMRLADDNAITFNEYTDPRPAPAPTPVARTKTKQPEVKPGTRKFAI